MNVYRVSLNEITITDMRVYDVILEQQLPPECSQYDITRLVAGSRITVTGELNLKDPRNPHIDNLRCEVKPPQEIIPIEHSYHTTYER